MIIYIKSIYRNLDIYIIFAMQLKIEILFIKPDYLTHSVTAIIYIYDLIHLSLICIEL